MTTVPNYDTAPEVYGRDHALVWLNAGTAKRPENIRKLVEIRARDFDRHSLTFTKAAGRAAEDLVTEVMAAELPDGRPELLFAGGAQ